MLFCERIHEIAGVVNTDGTNYRRIQVDKQPAFVEQTVTADSSVLKEVFSGHIVILAVVHRITVAVVLLVSIAVFLGYFNPEFFVLFEG